MGLCCSKRDSGQKYKYQQLASFLPQNLSLNMDVKINEKALKASGDEPQRSSSEGEGQVLDLNGSEEREVFKTTSDGVDFRTVTWQRAIIIFLKCQIATGVLGIPGAFGSLGAVGGVLSVIAWQALNTCW